MGNPFDRIKAETAAIKGTDYSSSSSLQRHISTNEKVYASIYDEYKASASDIASISDVDIKAAMEAETQATQKSLEKQLLYQTIGATVSSALAATPSLVTTITSLISMSRASKASEGTKIQQMEAKLAEAKTQSENWGKQITDATNAKPTAEANVKQYEKNSNSYQKEIDEHTANVTKLETSLNSETDEQIVSAKQELTTAEAMKTTKTVTETDATGNTTTREVEDPALRQQKDAAIEAAKRKIEDRKTALQKEIDEEKTLLNQARANKNEAETNKEAAEKDVKRYKDTIDDLTPKKTKLDAEIKKLESEIAKQKEEAAAKEAKEAKKQKKKDDK